MSHVISLPRRRRGRPKFIMPEEKDHGTPELQLKRASGATAEALDLCLSKGLISPDQHWCGIHLRWLYTLRYGAPGVRATDPLHLGGLEIACDDPQWRELREAEYHAAIARLKKGRATSCILSICAHNERPDFLAPQPKKIAIAINELQQLRDGLDILVGHWKKGSKR